MAEEMTHNQALQELQRFQNVWQAAAKLKEALQVAAGVEGAVKRLQAEETRLHDTMSQAEAAAEAAKQTSRQAISEAEAESKSKLKELKDLDDKRSQEYAAMLARREQETNNAIRHLEEAVVSKRKETQSALIALDDEITEKEARLDELNEQLDNLRNRLG